MDSIKVKVQIGEDGVFSTRLPITNQEIEAIVIYQSVQQKKQWSPHFFEKTCGRWQGEVLVREPQPEPQEREPLL
ncbi:hypothetical protein PCC7418_2969 [Halothece sp. PCC 7418]|uniref:hypothetical protein n=1 Tax=Halothece sp. (strain PCC 7418) TaxID=65093 RepID=UPI0002A089B8|nr:hypothetical protein [Halothece sp. PCC 7418]AFZ45098.1 hypothetical protein PCC7418_2969 [Halothece sp. PCC 7418]